MLLKIIALSLVAYLVIKLVKMALSVNKPEQSIRTPRSVNEQPVSFESEVLPSEDSGDQGQGYWQKKIQDAYRQGYRDGLEDGKKEDQL